MSSVGEKGAWKTLRRCTYLGTAAGYLHLLYIFLADLIVRGEPPSWGSLGNTTEAALRYLSAGLFLVPLVGAVAGAVVGGRVNSCFTLTTKVWNSSPYASGGRERIVSMTGRRWLG